MKESTRPIRQQVRLTPDLDAWLKKEAARQHRSLSQLMFLILDEYRQNHKPGKKAELPSGN